MFQQRVVFRFSLLTFILTFWIFTQTAESIWPDIGTDDDIKNKTDYLSSKKDILTKLINTSNENYAKLEKAAEQVKYNTPFYRLKSRELDYFKLLITRAERYCVFFNNPFLEQLIDTNINDLLMMNKFSPVLIELFTKDPIDTFKRIKKELYHAIEVDENWLTDNNHRSEVDRLTEYFNKIGLAIRYLETHNFSKNEEDYYRKVFEVLTTMYEFEKQAFLYQKQFSYNSIIYN